MPRSEVSLPDVDLPFSKIWENLQFSAMGRSTVRFGRWGVSTDLIYMRLGAVKNQVDVGLDQWLVQPVIEYQAASWLSPYAGARYLSLTAEIRGPLGNTGSHKQSWWDPVVGAEMRLPSTSKIRLRVRGDIGGFGAGSSFSCQVEPMLDWRVANRVSLQFGYRWLYADYKTTVPVRHAHTGAAVRRHVPLLSGRRDCRSGCRQC